MVGTPTSPASPSFNGTRPMSAVIRPARSSSRLSMSSKAGGSRASDEDAKTSVKVGECSLLLRQFCYMYYVQLETITNFGRCQPYLMHGGLFIT